MKETDCPTCKFPSVQSRDRLSEVCQFVIPRQTNTLIVPEYGEVPVLKGDLSWLSPEVSVFLNESAKLMTPSAIRICNGSVFEAQELREAIVNESRNEEQKQLDRLHIKFNDIGFDDVHVITKDRMDADPGTANTTSQKSTSSSSSNESIDNVRLSSQYMPCKTFEYAKEKRFNGCMTGRTMYVVPFSMGWIGSRYSVCGVQITDDPVLVLHLRTTFRVLSSVWDCIAATTNFLRCVHSIGMPRPIIRKVMDPTPIDAPVGSFIVLKHDEQQVWAHGYSFGRTRRYGKTFSVHAASWIGSKRGWLAESASIISITNPKNETINICYSSLSTFDNLGLSNSLPPGWKISVMSKKAAWIHWYNGKLHALAPENDEMSEVGSSKNLRNLLNGTPGEYQIQSFNPQNSKWSSDYGIPISGFIFENRRHDQFPLLLEANNWEQGVVLAAGIRVSVPGHRSSSTESLTKTSEQRSILVECPMLRADSINYSFAKYVNHWLDMGISVKSSSEKSDSDQSFPPPLFFMNLSQETDGKVIWPGGADNFKIFEYIFARCTNPSDLSNTTKSGIGKIPTNLELSTLVNLPPLLQVNTRFWLSELSKLRSFFRNQMESHFPPQLDKALNDLASAV